MAYSQDRRRGKKGIRGRKGGQAKDDFAAMDNQQQREIASKGGQSRSKDVTSDEWFEEDLNE
jgi:general stress protein YciG